MSDNDAIGEIVGLAKEAFEVSKNRNLDPEMDAKRISIFYNTLIKEGVPLQVASELSQAYLVGVR